MSHHPLHLRHECPVCKSTLKASDLIKDTGHDSLLSKAKYHFPCPILAKQHNHLVIGPNHLSIDTHNFQISMREGINTIAMQNYFAKQFPNQETVSLTNFDLPHYRNCEGREKISRKGILQKSHRKWSVNTRCTVWSFSLTGHTPSGASQP